MSGATTEPSRSEQGRRHRQWLESTCKLIITVRAGLLLVTLLSLPDQEDRATVIAIRPPGWASFVPLRFWTASAPRWCATPRGSASSSSSPP